MSSLVFMSLLLAAPGAPAASRAASVRPVALRCEYRVNPLGIDVREPRLNWILDATSPQLRGARQTAYRVLAASAAAKLAAGTGDLWDSGKVASAQSAQVVWGGKALTSGAQVFWKVQVWDEAARASVWSAPAQWSMGLLEAADWKGKWIGLDEDGVPRSASSVFHLLKDARWIWTGEGTPAKAAPAGDRYFRVTVTVPAGRKVKRAFAVMGADSGYELFVNGSSAGRGSMVRMPDVIPVDAWLKTGDNRLAVRVIHNRANRPAGLIAAIRVEFASGEPLLVASGPSWKTVVEKADGWQTAGFNDAAWAAASDLGGYGMEPWGDVGFKEERALPARMLRREFAAAKPVARATAYVSGLGISELYLNGRKVSDEVLSPNLTDYDKRVFYVTHDVTSMVARGPNAIGLMLGNGRFWAPRSLTPIGMRSLGFPKAIVQLDLEFADGTRESVVSDETWQLSTRGPVRANNEFDGEEFDARADMPGWSKAGFAARDWAPAHAVTGPEGMLVAQMAEPLRVMETLKPVSVKQLRPGVWIFDMGQNMVGWCRLHVAGPRGAEVRLRHAETLRPDGNLYVDNLRSARATDVYTLRGGGPEVWEPRFTYHGFRFVEVTGLPGVPTRASLEGRVVHDAMKTIADFESSDALLNHIHKNIYWGVRGNYRSIPTDCPQRDERQGWLGDRSMVSRSEAYLFDVAAFYSKWAIDLADAQRPNGAIPDVVPNYWVLYNDDVTWPSTFLFVPGMLYDQYGDTRIIERNYPGMKKWIEHMRGFLKDGLMPKDTYGDWCVPPEKPELIHSQDPARRTDGTFIGTAYYYHLLNAMTRYARVLGKESDATEYRELAATMRDAFVRRFYKAGLHQYDNGTQTSALLPLAFGITPAEDRQQVTAGLLRKVEQESNGHIGVGLIGAQWLMRTLSDNGRPDVALQIATQKTYPGWGYMIEKGATTIWELWNGDTADPAMNSGNHVMQIGDLGIWLYEYLGGIRPDPEKPGFQHVLIKPATVDKLSFVRASHQSLYGRIATRWQRTGGALTLEVTVPPNTGATVWVPGNSVTEGGLPASKAKGVREVRTEPGYTVIEAEPGSYRFTSQQ
jgi:alpha-L-rhamnosidase